MHIGDQKEKELPLILHHNIDMLSTHMELNFAPSVLIGPDENQYANLIHFRQSGLNKKYIFLFKL